MCMRSYNGDDRKSYALEAEASASCSLAFIAFFHLRSARQVESNKPPTVGSGRRPKPVSSVLEAVVEHVQRHRSNH